jgi:hypothetical protein
MSCVSDCSSIVVCQLRGGASRFRSSAEQRSRVWQGIRAEQIGWPEESFFRACACVFPAARPLVIPWCPGFLIALRMWRVGIVSTSAPLLLAELPGRAQDQDLRDAGSGLLVGGGHWRADDRGCGFAAFCTNFDTARRGSSSTALAARPNSPRCSCLGFHHATAIVNLPGFASVMPLPLCSAGLP